MLRRWTSQGADPRALGGAITAAVCGHWEDEPPCGWPHHTDLSSAGTGHGVTTEFTVEAEEEADVRRMIVGALRTVSRSGPDGHLNRWTLREATDR